MRDESYAKISIEKKEIKIEIFKYKTHVKKNKNDYVKVNGQTIYSGTTHYFTRNKIMHELKTHIGKSIPHGLDLSSYIPLEISMEWHTVPNFETVKYSKKQDCLTGGVVEDNQIFEPRFDVDNQWIWIKAFTDVLCKSKEEGGLALIPDDNVKYVAANGGIKFVPVEHLDNRKLVFTIKKHKSMWKSIWLKYFNFWGDGI